MLGVGEHAGPSGQVARESDDGAPDPVLVEPVQGEVAQPDSVTRAASHSLPGHSRIELDVDDGAGRRRREWWDDGAMTAASLLDREAIARICERHGVVRLRVFGSALSDRFDPHHSDVDFLVDYRPDAERTFTALFALRDELERVVGRPVDLIDTRNVRNPYFARSVFDSAQDVYAA